jgi:predicted nucleic acid-binding protein
MDLADASLVATAEAFRARRIFTIDRDDFETYRVKIGHRYYPFEILR